jgi:hypothetical protein
MTGASGADGSGLSFIEKGDFRKGALPMRRITLVLGIALSVLPQPALAQVLVLQAWKDRFGKRGRLRMLAQATSRGSPAGFFLAKAGSRRA